MVTTAQEYELPKGLPMQEVHLAWQEPSNDPEFQDGKFLGKPFPLELDIAIHPNDSGRIIINYPGAYGDIDGYNQKYKKLAAYIQDKKLGAVIRSGNDLSAGYTWDTDLRQMLKYAQEHAKEICGKDDPEIYLMGFSAGASAIAAVAHDYESIVPKVLLFAPSGDTGEQAVRKGLGIYKGEVYIVIGQDDDVVGVDAGKTFYDIASSATHRELKVIPNCDHQFRGETNGRIMSQAPFWAFAQGEKPPFPLPFAGIRLY